MKKVTINRKWPYLIAICIIVQLYSCQSKIDFKLTKGGSKSPLPPIESVKSFSLIYNPKANGTITVTLTDDSQYTAERLNSSQLSSLLVLLNLKGLQFDTKNEEFTLKWGNNE